MAKQLVPNVASFRVVQDYLGAEILNTIYVRDVVVAWSAAKLLATATVVRNSWQTNMLPLQAVALTLSRVDAEDLGSDPGAQATITSGAVGSLAGDPISAALAVNVAFVGDTGAFPRRGRNFFSGLTEGVVSGDTVTGAHAVAVKNAYDALETAISAAVISEAMVIVSRSQQSAADTAAIAAAREQLRVAIAGARRATGVSNTLQLIATGTLVATQRDRRV